MAIEEAMTTKNKITDARRGGILRRTARPADRRLVLLHAFALLIEGERDARMKGLLKGFTMGWWRLGPVAGHGAQQAFRPLDCGVVRIGEQTGRLQLLRIPLNSSAAITVSGPPSGGWSPRR